MVKWVAYYRVSTAKQGQSGLGLEAQRRAVLDHLAAGRGTLVEEFTEVESGRRTDRFQLDAALSMCRLHGAKLIIAKLDRLARNVAFVSRLMEEGVDFEAVDFPQANRFTIHMLAAFAEHEREQISQRTRAALAAAKARGQKLGNPQNMTPGGRERGSLKGNIIQGLTADRRAADVLPHLDRLQSEGATSLRALADGLNARGIPTPRGKLWAPASVRAVLARLPATSLA